MQGCIETCIISRSEVLCRLLDAEAVEEVLGELQRLMPNQDNKRFLINNPGWMTKVERGPKRLGPHPDDI